MKRLLCTGGGTAGHVIPALPVMEAFLEAGVSVDFIGSGARLEHDLLRPLPVTYHAISTGKLRRYFSLANFADAFRVLAGILQALLLVGRLRPAAVFSKGGFVSFPVVLAAWCWRIPVVAHESDLSPGLANRLALPFVKCLCVNFPVARPARFAGELVYTGTPVRRSLLEGDRERGRRLLSAPEGKPVIVVTGGSLGAETVNRVLREALPVLLEQVVVAHVCGPGKTLDRDPALEAAGYHQFEYVGDAWGDVLAAADLVVSRAGANTLYELLCLKKPNLLIPLSGRASRGDQIENARWAKQAGYSHVLSEDALDAPSLVAAVQRILSAPPEKSGRIAGFSPPDSVRLIADAIRRVAD